MVIELHALAGKKKVVKMNTSKIGYAADHFLTPLCCSAA